MYRAAMLFLACTSTLYAGPFNSPSVLESQIRVWANEIIDFQPTASGSTADLAHQGLGAPDNTYVSLGDLDAEMISQQQDPGSITVRLPFAISNGAGWDLAVFENAGNFFEPPFIFAELAHVEVSSNGIDFLRFPSESLNVEAGSGNEDTELLAEFGRDFVGLNTSNVRNLAGIHPAGIGTGFDLADLTDLTSGMDIDLNAIEYVRIVDVPGDGSTLDSMGRPILDPWPSAEPTGGFDLDAVGARYPVPEPQSLWIALAPAIATIFIRRTTRR